MTLRLRPSARAARSRPRGRRGFSLVELIVAMMLLTVGVLGLASVSAYAIRMDVTATRANTATLVAQSRMEWLRSKRCADIASGTATTGIVSESWTVTNVGTKTVTVKGTFSYTSRQGATRTFEESTTITCYP